MVYVIICSPKIVLSASLFQLSYNNNDSNEEKKRNKQRDETMGGLIICHFKAKELHTNNKHKCRKLYMELTCAACFIWCNDSH